MPSRPTPIIITCFADITTRITLDLKTIEDTYGESLQQRAAQMIIENAHYNEVFEIQAASIGNFERALAEANHFKLALREAIKKRPDLNLLILGDNPAAWEAEKAKNFEHQIAILRKAKMVADKISAYPNTIPEADLKKTADNASYAELLKAKIAVQQKSMSTKTAHKIMNPDADLIPLSMLFFAVGLALLISIFAMPFSLAWLGLAIPLIVLGVGTFLFNGAMNHSAHVKIDSETKAFNEKTGRAKLMPELTKISPVFLKELEFHNVSKVTPHTAPIPVTKAIASKNPSLPTTPKRPGKP